MSASEQAATSSPLLADEPGRTEFLIGNEAIARGAIEAGVGFASGYPGTPSTEVTESFALLSPTLGIPFEYSVNEKIALEMAFAASLSGARSIVAMKHLGLMSAGDPLSTMPYIGTKAGMVIVSAGDPSCLTSPNEQDQRHLADTLHLPTFDPRTPQDALDATRFAFELSERCQLPVLLRPTTRVCHTRSAVRFGEILERATPAFERAPGRFLPLPANARRMREEIEDRLRVAQQLITDAGFFQQSGAGTIGVLSSGAPAAACEEILERNGLLESARMLSLGVVYPLPEEPLLAALRELETVLVVEELSPYLEDRVRALIGLHGLDTRVLGKRTGHLPMAGEYLPAVIRGGLKQAFGFDAPAKVEVSVADVPGRPPILCAACPHRSAFFSVRAAFGEDVLYFNDIGCYTLGCAPPLSTGDALLSMGSSLALAAGVARTTGARTVGFIGDSTFFHSGMPVLLNVIKENVRMVAVILDNAVTAMTGFQESPSACVEQGRLERHVDIEGIVRALGATQVECVDPNDLATTVAAFERAASSAGLSVIITQRPCPVFAKREGLDDEPACAPEGGAVQTYTVDASMCAECGRSGCGHRCSQGVVESFERSMVRARALEEGGAQGRPKVAACADACPLMLCVQGYATHIAAGNYGAAYELILEELALPGSVCRVCDRPCESVCALGSGERSVAINDLKRFAVDWAESTGYRPNPPERDEPSGERVAVVGAGPAGLAAASELWQRGHDVCLFDAADEPGGLLISGIPEYRLPREVVRRDVSRLLELGVRFEGGRRLGDNLDLDVLLSEYAGVVLAIGAGRGIELALDCAEEGTPEVLGALEYLRAKEDFSASAARRTVVIGGGNSAVDSARVALRSGAERVSILCLEAREFMPAIADEVHEAGREGVVIQGGMRVLRLRRGGVECVRVAAEDATSRNPEDYHPVDDEAHFIEAERVIMAVGQRPDREAIGDSLEWSGAWLSADGNQGRCSRARVFAAGDLVGGSGSVTGAMAAGRRAAWGLDRDLRGPEVADRRQPPPEPMQFGMTDGTRFSVARSGCGSARRRPPELDLSARGDFSEVIGQLAEEDARAEAARCAVCGTCGNCRSCLDLFGCPAFLADGNKAAIDPALCTGCGVCAQFCPNGAIHPVAPDGEVAAR